MTLSVRWREDFAITFGTLFGPLFFILENTVGASVGFAMTDGTNARPITAESAGGKETAVAWVRNETRLPVLASTFRCDGLGGPNAQSGGILMHSIEAGKSPSAGGPSLCNFTFMELGDIGCTALARILELGLWPKPESAEGDVYLMLSNNSFGDEGAVSLATALASKDCPKGISLQFSSCYIGDRGAIALLEAGVPWKSLDLSKNEIGDDGAAAVAAAISSGLVPTASQDGWINLDGNSRITDVGATALITAVKSGGAPKMLRTISVDRTAATDVMQDELYEALQAHAVLHPSPPRPGFGGARKPPPTDGR
eukprot:m.452021 g.452021  ORF g.452021 m.452021 type:complete len:312 (+) comp20253_c0_seq1:1557-2492(+)